MALCEAMISGVPVLSADCPTGPREILAPGTTDIHYLLTVAQSTPYGVLLPMTDKPAYKAAWVTAVDRLLGNAGEMQQMSEQARGRMKDFSKERILQKWVDTIKEVAAAASR
jgi:glycosyltransferase involved in cell wall biosynthesis